MSETVREIYYNDNAIQYHFQKKRVKNINLRVHQDGSVHVSAPSYVSVKAVDEFVLSKAQFIIGAIKKFGERTTEKPKEYISGEVYKFLGNDIMLDVKKGDGKAYADGGNLFVYVQNPLNKDERKKTIQVFFDEQCKTVFKKIVDEIYPVFIGYGIPYPLLRIKNMKSRWGSCIPSKGIVTLNRQLIAAPVECIEYVVVHEFCHFLQANHSKRFYEYVEKHMPDWKMRKALLNKCSTNAV